MTDERHGERMTEVMHLVVRSILPRHDDIMWRICAAFQEIGVPPAEIDQALKERSTDRLHARLDTAREVVQALRTLGVTRDEILRALEG